MNKRVWAAMAVVLLLATAGAIYYIIGQKPSEAPAAPDEAPVAEQPTAPATPVEAEPETPAPASESEPAQPATPPPALPPLDDSDAPLRADLDAKGVRSLDALLAPSRLIRRTVATIDSLDRDPVRAKLRPIKGPEGQPVVEGEGDTLELSPDNADRYRVQMDAVDALDPVALVGIYRHFEPLFDQAYRELGYPSARFRPRLLEVIDHLLATPQVGEPVRLVRPKDLYEFADPTLEDLSWGQKVMIRIGPANAEIVRDKLRAIRAQLADTAAGGQAP